VRPLLADYLDRLAAELGSPPDPARAQALVHRLPLTIRIDGPQVQWDSAPASRHDREHDDGRLGDRFLLRTAPTATASPSASVRRRGSASRD